MADQKIRTSPSNNKELKNKVFIHPEATDAYFGNYFAVEQSSDDVVVSFGQRLPSENKDGKLYEIRRRVVMTNKGLQVLTDLLNKLVKGEEKK